MIFLSKLNLKNKLYLGFCIPLTLFIVIAVTVFFSLSKLIKTSGWVDHTYEAIGLGNAITSSLVNMETGLRGFLVSGKEDFLDPYHSGKEEFKSLVQQTKDKVADNSEQVARIEKVEKLEKDWLEKHVNVAIEYRREVKQGEQATQDFKDISSRTVGKEKFDGVRAALSKIEASLTKDNDTKGLLLLQFTLTDMINQETGQRGFLLSGNEISLEPYHAGIKGFDKHVASLARHLRQKAKTQSINHLDTVVKLAKEWRQEAAEPEINARREVNKVTRSIDDITHFIEKGIGKNYMDSMRTILDELVGIESKLIIVRNDSKKSIALTTKIITALGALIAIIIGGVISTLLTKNILKQLGTDPKELQSIAEQIAKGNLNLSLDPNTSTGVRRSMAIMRENLEQRQTSDLAIQKEIDALVDHASKGDFTQSIDLHGKEGVFLGLSKGLNNLLSTCNQGLNDVIRVLGAIAKGDLSQTITRDYQGAFNELKQYSNNTVSQLSLAMGEIGDVVHAANEGDFNSKIDISKKSGFFKELSSNLNDLMATTNSGLNDTIRILEALAQGDLSQTIDKEYKGSFDQLKQYSNNTVTQMKDVMGEISDLISHANQGDFTSAIDVSHKSGFFKTLSDDLNTLMLTTKNGLDDVLRILGALAKGDLSQSISAEYQGTFDTLKQYANNTVNQIKEVMDSINMLVDSANQGDFQTQLEMAGKTGFFKELSQNLNTLMNTTDSGLNDVMAMLSALADGDLSARIDKHYEGAFGKLKQDANSTAEKLTEVIEKIKTTSSSINTSTKEISQGNIDLSRRTESQASSLEETASSMEEMTSIISQSEEKATHANTLSINASTIADEGGAVVKRAVTAMEQISDSSKKISDIIVVIDEIAFQTNLLALNAAVEAARAGEQGRGFAVVAGEVRNLAQRSAGAAKEIKDLIRDSVNKVEDGTTLVNNSGKTLEEIVSAVREVSEMINDISGSAKEQTSGIQQVNAAVAEMDEMTQQNSALVEEASASFTSMASDVQDMIDIIGFFSTHNKNTY